MLEGAPKTGFDDVDDNDRVMEMVIVMAVLGLFPVLMPAEDENCGASNFSGVLKRLCVCVCVCVCLPGAQRKMLAGESLLDNLA